MIPFRKLDQIMHPMYGIGDILKVTRVNEKRSTLEVFFPEKGITKSLNSQWVEENCTYQPYQKPSKPQFTKGVYQLDPTLSDGTWQVFWEQSASISALDRQGTQYILSHTTPGIHMVQIERYAVVVLSPEEADTDDQIEKAAQGYITSVLERHPDFGCIETPDGGVGITMAQDCLWQFIPPEAVKRKASGEVSLQTMLAGRQALMQACYQKQMYAILRSAPKRPSTHSYGRKPHSTPAISRKI